MDQIKELIAATHKEDYSSFQSILEGVIETRFQEKLAESVADVEASIFTEGEDEDEKKKDDDEGDDDDDDSGLDEQKQIIKKRKFGHSGVQKRTTSTKDGYKWDAKLKKEVKMSPDEIRSRKKGAIKGNKKGKAKRKKSALKTRALNK